MVEKSMQPTVLIVDDEKVMRFCLARILEKAGYSTRTFSSGEELLASPLPAGRCCLLLDVNLNSHMDGPAVQKQLLEMGSGIPVVFLSAFATVPIAVDAMKTGALDVLSKPIDRRALLRTVENALKESEEVMSRQRTRKRQEALIETLTPRELEILTWVITGMLNKQIAAELGITERTVKAHRANLMEKLGVVSVADLVRMADVCGVQPAACTDS